MVLVKPSSSTFKLIKLSGKVTLMHSEVNVTGSMELTMTYSRSCDKIPKLTLTNELSISKYIFS